MVPMSLFQMAIFGLIGILALAVIGITNGLLRRWMLVKT
jgi:hypothetical protein